MYNPIYNQLYLINGHNCISLIYLGITTMVTTLVKLPRKIGA